MARCGCSGSCGCRIVEGTSVTVTGHGTPDDPYVINASSGIAVTDNGDGTWTIAGVTGYMKTKDDTLLAGKAPISAAWVASTPVKAGQLLHNAGILYRVTADMTTPSSFNTTNLTVVSGGNSLTTTAVKTANYTAGANEIVPMDATGGARTVTLPNAPADKTQVIVKKIDSSGNAVTIACAGTDVFNKTGGVTTHTLPYLNRAEGVQYDAARGVWTTITIDLAMPSLPVIKCFESGGTYVRQNYAGPVQFEGADPPGIRTDGVTTGGNNQAVQGLDNWAITP